MTLHSYRERTLLVIPIRVALGAVWVVAARLMGLATAPALLAFAVGLLGMTFVLWLSYGIALHNIAIIIPNIVAAIVSVATIVVSLQYR